MNKQNKTRYCTQCGASIAADCKFCTSCGARVTAPTTQSTPAKSLQGANSATAPGVPVNPANPANTATSASAQSPIDQPVPPAPTTPPNPTVPPIPTTPTTPTNPQNNDAGNTPKEAKRNKVLIIISIVVAAALVLGIGGYAGWRYYDGHSHSHAQQRYIQSLEQLKDADKQLTKTLQKTSASTRTITAAQVDEPDALTAYTKAVDKVSKLVSRSAGSEKAGTHDSDESTVRNPNEATAQELNRAADANEKATKARTDAKTKLEESARKVTDSRDSASKVLNPVEKAVAAAEKRRKSAEREINGKPLDAKAIASGDYSSLDGTWTNNAGAWMQIKDGKLIPQTPISGTTAPYTLKNCKGLDACITDSILTGENETYTMAEVPDTQVQLVQEGAVDCSVRNEGICERQDPYSIVAVQKNAILLNMAYDGRRDESQTDPTDSSRDRIIVSHSMGQGGVPLCLDASYAYYRDESTFKPSAAAQKQIDDAVKAAQQSIDGLKQPWAKAAFQCRLDVVSKKRSSCATQEQVGATQTGMDIKAIAKGDCSSIAGNWVSARGVQFVYKDQCPSFSYTDGSGHWVHWKQPELHETYAEQSNTGYTAGGRDSRVFLPKGSTLPDKYLKCFGATSDNSDINRDRIFDVNGMSCQTPSDPTNNVHYRR